MVDDGQGVLRFLKPEDLERVVEIDGRITGRSRKKFFEKRLQAALADTSGFIAVATQAGGILSGFAIARLLTGEFGEQRRVAVIDVIGVDVGWQGRNHGKILIDGIIQYAKTHGIQELRTQVEWQEGELLEFFRKNDFKLAPIQVLERITTRNI